MQSFTLYTVRTGGLEILLFSMIHRLFQVLYHFKSLFQGLRSGSSFFSDTGSGSSAWLEATQWVMGKTTQSKCPKELGIGEQFRARISKHLRSPGIDSASLCIQARRYTITPHLQSYRPARLHGLAESIPWNGFLGFLKRLQIRAQE